MEHEVLPHYHIRINKLLEALRKHRINQAMISVWLGRGWYDAKITRLKQQQAPDKQEEVKSFVLLVEAHYENLVRYDPNSGDYTHVEPINTPPGNTLVLETTPKLQGFQFLTAEMLQGLDEFCILDTWPHYLNQGGERHIIDWFRSVRSNIRILVMHPLCDAFRLRIAGIPNQDLRQAQEQLLESLDNFLRRAEHREVSCKVEVRLYETVPAINAYILDDTVHFGHFFSGDLSQNFFFTRTTGADNYVVQQIKEHFNRVWDDPKTSLVTHERVSDLRKLTILKFYRLYELGDEYCIYNLDESNEGIQLQTSRLSIDKQTNTCTLAISNRLASTDEIFQGRIKVVSQGNILFTFTQGHFFLEILIAPADYSKPNLLQAVYLHSDNKRFPRGAFAFLVDMEKQPDFAKAPSRYKIGDNLNPIEHYLAFQRFGVLSYKKRKSAIHDLQAFTDENRKVLEAFAKSGTWGMIYPERNPVDTSLRDHDFLNAVGTGKFWIQLDETDGTYKAHLETLYIKDFKGLATVTSVAGVLYLNCTLMQSDEFKIFLNIIIRIGHNFGVRRKKGVYNIVYQNGQIGCGLLTVDPEIELTPSHFNPIKNAAALPNDTPEVLKFKRGSSLILQPNDQAPCHYAGIYDVFSYGRLREDAGETKCIILSRMRIHDNGFVTFKGLLPHGEASGYASLVLGNLYIELKNGSEEFMRERRGYFIISVKDAGNPLKLEVYGGIFAGLSHPERLPISKRLVARYIGDAAEDHASFDQKKKGERIRLFSPEYDALDRAIRDATTGRLKNYIGFQAFQKTISSLHELEAFNAMELPLAQIFLESALHKTAHLNDTASLADIIEVLRQAKNHGFTDFSDFEKKLKDVPSTQTLFNNAAYQKLKKT